MLEIRVGNKYRLGKKIGSGSFGEVFLGVNIQTNEEFAVKLESINCRHPQLSYENKLMKMLQDNEGFPSSYWYGIEGTYNVLIMELLGPSLEDLFHYCNCKFSLKTVLMAADQILSRVECIHSKNFLHRDIKPDNFLIGLGEKSKIVHLIDFGLSKKFRDPRTYAHIPFKEGKNLTGTARYASIYTHLGMEQSRRDDLESMFYVLAYLLLGSLPWQGMLANSKQEKYQKILSRKEEALDDSTFQDIPQELIMFLSYCRSLKFEEKPDYAYIRSLLKDIMIRENFNNDFIFEWTLQNYTSHKQLRNKLLGDIKRNAKNDESKIAINESNIAPPELPAAPRNSAVPEAASKKKCVVF